MNIQQAFRHLTESDIDVVLTCSYFNRIESHTFDHENFENHCQYIGFKHKVECTKRDFRDISTHHGGDKSDCKFVFSAI